MATATCQCGHDREAHAGRTMRGVCYDCYAESHHGRDAYCSRFRNPKNAEAKKRNEEES